MVKSTLDLRNIEWISQDIPIAVTARQIPTFDGENCRTIHYSKPSMVLNMQLNIIKP
jgi:hypothetical protein